MCTLTHVWPFARSLDVTSLAHTETSTTSTRTMKARSPVKRCTLSDTSHSLMRRSNGREVINSAQSKPLLWRTYESITSPLLLHPISSFCFAAKRCHPCVAFANVYIRSLKCTGTCLFHAHTVKLCFHNNTASLVDSAALFKSATRVK